MHEIQVRVYISLIFNKYKLDFTDRPRLVVHEYRRAGMNERTSEKNEGINKRTNDLKNNQTEKRTKERRNVKTNDIKMKKACKLMNKYE